MRGVAGFFCPIIRSCTGLEVKKNVFISVPYVAGLSEKFKKSFDIPVYRSSLKEPTPLNTSLYTPKTKSHHN